jgi:hypothetical protein
MIVLTKALFYRHIEAQGEQIMRFKFPRYHFATT